VQGATCLGIETNVLEVFFERLSTADGVSGEVVEALRGHLGGQSVPKAEQLVELFQRGSGDALT
jgi:hypothetical protein